MSQGEIMTENDTEYTETEKRYSSFTPILILVLSFLFVNVIQITNTISQMGELKKVRAQVEAMQGDLDKILPQAKIINDTIEGLLRDLVAMAPNSPGAQKIVTDFQIRLAEPNGGQSPAPAPKP